MARDDGRSLTLHVIVKPMVEYGTPTLGCLDGAVAFGPHSVIPVSPGQYVSPERAWPSRGRHGGILALTVFVDSMDQFEAMPGGRETPTTVNKRSFAASVSRPGPRTDLFSS